MNWDFIESNWKHFKDIVRTRWGRLTDDHLDLVSGKREQLLGKLQEAYGVDRIDADSEIIAFEVQHEILCASQGTPRELPKRQANE